MNFTEYIDPTSRTPAASCFHAKSRKCSAVFPDGQAMIEGLLPVVLLAWVLEIAAYNVLA
jgi:hypothetical protein